MTNLIRRHLRLALFSMGLSAVAAILVGCGDVSNNPHPPGSEKTNTLYLPFSQRSPKYLDPTSSYSNDETPYTYQVYEPLYGYHYLKRPYELAPRAAKALAAPVYLDKTGRELPQDVAGEEVAETVFRISIKEGIRFAPHPAFAKTPSGEYRYRNLQASDVADKFKLSDFAESGTRELTADDYVYGIRRLATPRCGRSAPRARTLPRRRAARSVVYRRRS